MRVLFFILVLGLLKEEAFSQEKRQAVFLIDQLPRDGVLLNSGWRFYSGDDSAFASPDFDDSEWQPIDPTLDIHSLPQLWKRNICWFRLHIYVDTNIVKKQLLFLIRQTGGSEVYLNGQVLATFGNVHRDSTKTKAISPVNGSFIPFPGSAHGKAVLAVRFALQRGIFYSNFYGLDRPAFALTVAEAKVIGDNINSNKVVYFELARVGIFLILSILHLALFRFNRSQKANFYFLIYAFLAFLSSLAIDLTTRHVSVLSGQMLLLSGVIFVTYLSNLFFILAVYKVFHYRSGWVLWLVAAFALSSVFLFSSSRQATIWLINIFFILSMIEVIRVSVVALRLKQRGARIVIWGATAFVVFFLLFILMAQGYIPAGPDFIYGHFAFNIGFLSLPIAISVYLALEASYASRTLEEKLVEVQRLSQQRTEQEREKQKLLASHNEMLEKQVAERTSDLQQSLEELKSTQAQLIQSEKMASLGELTAGIAHEIQNPLNFVNNFSEVNKELIEEVKSEKIKDKSERDDKLEMQLLDDIEKNLDKISHHGKRADAIVKSMLQHSRISSGQKELTDINALADEYLRLASHGLRAKDKSFNTITKTEFDSSIGKINVVPQDIGRVLLNLINNAFYAVNEKGQLRALSYEPLVIIRTKRLSDKIEISVEDNGKGVPQKILDKIFQPFFTTKPTGEGTGLGLSLAYDIVKAHGGVIKVETKEGEGSGFVIQLPIV